ncbi:TetR/AcrR family transcriptional regulator [Microbacterium sp. zg.Y625]|uniref:TetR/AcrR family transcriptional regulator n=1 Tax=Microbacterium jiangjiandongii TaxID=3049071 RepID=UPI00214AD8F2|nr:MULTISPECIES: TetR/AcrR family transcriptional regulator [unclassified Microbacterium]MCR2792854.1 TetR/AcrR family transcriptional regulator [Microbacterium sp. zg.Y625]MCR2814511.1 TetR/AcrR family transcriptional regulator [Microbacterium sp. zg.Y843]WIM26826.1 helix-turn-helix domain-containing protein [Microbacterium sp. zg-Y625]
MAMRERTREKILDAADELFFSVGVAATPIDAVIQRAGVSSATLYRGFDGKEGVLAAALERRHLAWMRAWDAAIAAQPSAGGRLLAVFDALDLFRQQPTGSRWCAFLGSAAEFADPPAAVAEAVRRDTDTMRERLAEIAAEVDPARADALADAMLLIVTGDLAMRLRDPAHSTATARALAAALVESIAP